MNTILRAALLGAIAVVHAQAAPVELAVSTNGTGSVTIGSYGDRVSKANLVLKRDGKFSLGLVGSEDTRISGTWQPANRDDVALRISEVGGRSARGVGVVELRSRRGDFEVDEITINGENDKGRTVSATFATPRYSPPPPPPAPRPPAVVMDSERPGFGKLEIGGREQARIARAHVQLYADGRALVHFDGNRHLHYEGTWKRSGEGVATLKVRGGMKSEPLDGMVRYRYGRLSRVELSGTRDGRYHSLEFEAAR